MEELELLVEELEKDVHQPLFRIQEFYISNRHLNMGHQDDHAFSCIFYEETTCTVQNNMGCQT